MDRGRGSFCGFKLDAPEAPAEIPGPTGQQNSIHRRKSSHIHPPGLDPCTPLGLPNKTSFGNPRGRLVPAMRRSVALIVSTAVLLATCVGAQVSLACSFAVVARSSSRTVAGLAVCLAPHAKQAEATCKNLSLHLKAKPFGEMGRKGQHPACLLPPAPTDKTPPRRRRIHGWTHAPTGYSLHPDALRLLPSAMAGHTGCLRPSSPGAVLSGVHLRHWSRPCDWPLQ